MCHILSAFSFRVVKFYDECTKQLRQAFHANTDL